MFVYILSNLVPFDNDLDFIQKAARHSLKEFEQLFNKGHLKDGYIIKFFNL